MIRIAGAVTRFIWQCVRSLTQFDHFFPRKPAEGNGRFSAQEWGHPPGTAAHLNSSNPVISISDRDNSH
jgi:hypothetical protein